MAVLADIQFAQDPSAKGRELWSARGGWSSSGGGGGGGIISVRRSLLLAPDAEG